MTDTITRVIAALIVLGAGGVRTWLFFRISAFRIDLDRSDPVWFLWGSQVKLYSRASYTRRGRELLPWLVASEVGIGVVMGVALWLLARRGLL